LNASLKGLCTNAHGMGRPQQELKICVLLQGYDLIGFTGKRWYSSHDWRAATAGYRLCRKDRLGQQGGERAVGIQSSAYGWMRTHLRDYGSELVNKLMS